MLGIICISIYKMLYYDNFSCQSVFGGSSIKVILCSFCLFVCLFLLKFIIMEGNEMCKTICNVSSLNNKKKKFLMRGMSYAKCEQVISNLLHFKSNHSNPYWIMFYWFVLVACSVKEEPLTKWLQWLNMANSPLAQSMAGSKAGSANTEAVEQMHIAQ